MQPLYAVEIIEIFTLCKSIGFFITNYPDLILNDLSFSFGFKSWLINLVKSLTSPSFQEFWN